MPRGITAQEAAARLESAGFANAARYTKGVQGKGGAWFSGASKAGANYQQGVQAAIAADKFGKGVRDAGAAAYDSGVQQKGSQNWPTGMQQAGDKYQRKIAKFVPLWDQALPTPGGAKRSPANVKRMQENMDRFVRTSGA